MFNLFSELTFFDFSSITEVKVIIDDLNGVFFCVHKSVVTALYTALGENLAARIRCLIYEYTSKFGNSECL